MKIMRCATLLITFITLCGTGGVLASLASAQASRWQNFCKATERFETIPQLVALAQVGLAWSKFGADSSYAQKLLSADPADLKKCWGRIAEDQLLGSGRAVLNFAAHLMFLIALRGNDRVDSATRKILYSGIGVSLLVSFFRCIADLITREKMYPDARMRNAYAKMVRVMNVEQEESLRKLVSTQKHRAFWQFVCSVLQAGLFATLNLQSGDACLPGQLSLNTERQAPPPFVRDRKNASNLLIVIPLFVAASLLRNYFAAVARTAHINQIQSI